MTNDESKQPNTLPEPQKDSFLEETLNSCGVGTLVLDSDFRVKWVNKAIEDFFGVKKEHLLGKDKRTLIDSTLKHCLEKPEAFQTQLRTDYENNTFGHQFECHVLPTEDRPERWLLRWSTPVEPGPERRGRREHYTDITRQKQMEFKLRDTEKRFRLMAEQSEAVIWLTDPAFEKILFINSRYERVFGGNKEKLLEDPLNVLEDIHPEDHDNVKASIQKLIDGKKVELEYRIHAASNFGRWARAWGIPVREDGSTAYLLGSVQDITDQKNREEQLRNLALTDELTGLPNRKALFERLDQEINRSRRYESPLSVAILDVDHFKRINDHHGHLTGDAVLRRIADVLTQTLRDVDFAGRYGGEEFGVVLPETPLGEAERVLERVRNELAESVFTIDGREVDPYWSVGVTDWQGDDRTVEDLVGRADDALYEAKDRGRNCTVSR